MNIAILGHGKMGKAIEKKSISLGYNVKYIADGKWDTDLKTKNVDVAIDFSTPDAAYYNITKCIEQGIPIVSGTTGWLDRYEDVEKMCHQKNGAFIYGSNFSIGVNIFFQINKKLAALTSKYSDYQIGIDEIHHTKKLDKPSGTAITLANNINSVINENKGEHKKVPIKSYRQGKTIGTHTVKYTSDIDDIIIEHVAHNRSGFVLGALYAAKWLVGKKGVFNVEDVFEL